MDRIGRLTSWVVPFAVGLVVGLLIDVAFGVSGSLGWVVVAIPFGAAGLTVVGSLLAEVFKQSLRDDTDRYRRMERHAESIAENALAGLPGLEFRSDLSQFVPRGVTGLAFSNADGTFSLSSLKLWRYAEVHVLQDSTLGPRWRALSEHLSARRLAREKLERLYTQKVEVLLAQKLGPGWVPRKGFGTPQEPRWYESEVIWNWILSRRILGSFSDRATPMNYNRADVPNEIRYVTSADGFDLLSSNQANGPRGESLKSIITFLQSDEVLREAQDDAARLDAEITKEVEALREPAAEYYERTVESKKIGGKCPVCPE